MIRTSKSTNVRQNTVEIKWRQAVHCKHSNDFLHSGSECGQICPQVRSQSQIGAKEYRIVLRVLTVVSSRQGIQSYCQAADCEFVAGIATSGNGFGDFKTVQE